MNVKFLLSLKLRVEIDAMVYDVIFVRYIYYTLASALIAINVIWRVIMRKTGLPARYDVRLFLLKPKLLLLAIMRWYVLLTLSLSLFTSRETRWVGELKEVVCH